MKRFRSIASDLHFQNLQNIRLFPHESKPFIAPALKKRGKEDTVYHDPKVCFPSCVTLNSPLCSSGAVHSS